MYHLTPTGGYYTSVVRGLDCTGLHVKIVTICDQDIVNSLP